MDLYNNDKGASLGNWYYKQNGPGANQWAIDQIKKWRSSLNIENMKNKCKLDSYMELFLATRVIQMIYENRLAIIKYTWTNGSWVSNKDLLVD